MRLFCSAIFAQHAQKNEIKTGKVGDTLEDRPGQTFFPEKTTSSPFGRCKTNTWKDTALEQRFLLAAKNGKCCWAGCDGFGRENPVHTTKAGVFLPKKHFSTKSEK